MHGPERAELVSVRIAHRLVHFLPDSESLRM